MPGPDMLVMDLPSVISEGGGQTANYGIMDMASCDDSSDSQCFLL